RYQTAVSSTAPMPRPIRRSGLDSTPSTRDSSDGSGGVVRATGTAAAGADADAADAAATGASSGSPTAASEPSSSAPVSSAKSRSPSSGASSIVVSRSTPGAVAAPGTDPAGAGSESAAASGACSASSV